MKIKVRNTQENKTHLNTIGRHYDVEGNFLVIHTTHAEKAYLQTGQMTKRSFKKNLGL